MVMVKPKPRAVKLDDDDDDTPTVAVKPVPKPAGNVIIPAKPKIVMPKFSLDNPDSELGGVIKQVQERFSVEVAELLSKKKLYYDRIPTGIFTLDLGLSGGFLTSRGSMLYGEKSTGKSTVAMMVCINAQRLYPDMACAWIDIEGTFDLDWFVKHGGDPERLILCEPESGENAVDIADAISRTKEISVIVTDSIAMLVPMKEIEGSAEDSLPGVHARLVGNYLRRLNNSMLTERHRDHRTLILHINQFRMKIGVSFGDPRTLPGGKALEFCTTQQVELRNSEKVAENGDIKWNEHVWKITKDKTGGRLRNGVFKMVRDPTIKENKGLPEGTIDQAKQILEFGARIGMVEGRYEILGYGKHPNSAEWSAAFLRDPEMYVDVMSNIIMRYRETWGLATTQSYQDFRLGSNK